MTRREFIHNAALGTAATLGALPHNASATNNDNGPFIDLDKLQARNNNRSTVVARNGMVCSSHPLASMAGIDILKAGGNCIDAAICTNAMLGLMEPASNGIGGDLFAILWSEKDQQLYGLNASGRAPYEWNLEKAANLNLTSIPGKSPLAWTVPGCVSGWGALNKRFGKLSLANCLEPSIHAAKEGFPISPLISKHFSYWSDESAPHMAQVYHPNGHIPSYGEIFKNPLLAQSYQDIAEGGMEAYYTGRIAEAIEAKSAELGGFMSLRDLKDHTATWVDPVSTNYRGWDVWEIPPNGQGIAALQILNIMERFDVGSLKPNSAEHLHLFIEAKKLAFEDRALFYADPEFADVPTEWLISKKYAKKQAKRIDLKRAQTELPINDPKLDSDTIYMTASDSEGNMISLIQSNYYGFGSTICPDGVGFPIQNRGMAFSLDPNHRNKLEPHKRPFHTIIPAFMTKDKRPVMSFGVMGGDFQPQGHAQVVMNMIDFGMSPQQATDQPRLAHLGSSSPWGGTMTDGGSLKFERGFSEEAKAGLSTLGHQIESGVEAHGGYQAIWRTDDPLLYFGGSDARKDGAALGY